ncbi:YhcB family protein [Catenovulum sp. 2E275]|uniref:YhcB family protein n=1 Tax=Catenovulum sp. 2E275 TaxID=2980497 RepID=UPI0021D251BE|nr:YhcB family protein [Catenovulum sp. 2E275]MCU4675476.1 YhcB family protein [Catenovulum sp. 2E275]
MTWLTGIVIFLIGGLAGFAAGRIIPALTGKQQKLQAELDKHIQAQETFKTEVNQYLTSVNSAMQSIAEQAQVAAAESQKQFNHLAEKQDKNKQYIPFFTPEISELLNNNAKKENRSSMESPMKSIPLDYSENKMGWFAAENKKEV